MTRRLRSGAALRPLARLVMLARADVRDALMGATSDDLAEVSDALKQTLASRSARFEIVLFNAQGSEAPQGFFASVREAGVFLAVLFAVGAVVMRLSKLGRSMRREIAETWKPGAAEGIVDFRGWRSASDYGGYATLETRENCWAGASGRALATLEPVRARPYGPLWLLSLLGGATDARMEGEEVVEGADCGRFAVTVDLARANARAPDDVALPAVGGFRELSHLPLHTWIGPDQRFRRLSFDTAAPHTVTFTAFDVDLPTDWDHLPTFRTPGRA